MNNAGIGSNQPVVRWSCFTSLTGAVSGALNTAGQAGDFVCTVLFGYLVGASGGYHVPIFIIAGMVLVRASLFWQIDASRPLLAE